MRLLGVLLLFFRQRLKSTRLHKFSVLVVVKAFDAFGFLLHFFHAIHLCFHGALHRFLFDPLLGALTFPTGLLAARL